MINPCPSRTYIVLLRRIISQVIGIDVVPKTALADHTTATGFIFARMKLVWVKREWRQNTCVLRRVYTFYLCRRWLLGGHDSTASMVVSYLYVTTWIRTWTFESLQIDRRDVLSSVTGFIARIWVTMYSILLVSF